LISVRSEVQILPGPPIQRSENRGQKSELPASAAGGAPAVPGLQFCFLISDFCHLDGGVAQLGEHLLCKQGVVGSIPITSTTDESAAFIAKLHRPGAPTVVCAANRERRRHLARARRRGKKNPRYASCIPDWGGWGILLMENRKEASCVTVAGDRVRPKGRVRVSRSVF
jgi:hypothetical protein